VNMVIFKQLSNPSELQEMFFFAHSPLLTQVPSASVALVATLVPLVPKAHQAPLVRAKTVAIVKAIFFR
jgi:hypothetical protein